VKVALLSDLHTNLRSRREEARRVLGAIPDNLRERGIELIQLGGDLHEEPPSAEEEDWTARWLRELAEIAPVVGVTGNHDIGCAAVPRLRLPCSEGRAPRHPIVIADAPRVVYAAGCAIALLPWPRTAHLLAALPEAGPDQRHEAGIAALRAVLLGLRNELEQHDGPRILVAHAHVRGARMGAHAPATVAFNLGLEDLALVGADLVHLGHLHEFQAWSWSVDGREVPILYPGSPFANTWGETERKGYVVVDFDQEVCGCPHGYARGGCGACDNRGAIGWDFVPTMATPLVHLEYDWQGAEHGLAGELVPYSTTSVAGAEVRLRYTVRGDYREAAARAAEELRGRLLAEGALRVELDPVIQPTVRARAPEITSAPDVPEKLALWARGQGCEESRVDRLRGMVTGLEESQ
jgi:exonuclease SbcD